MSTPRKKSVLNVNGLVVRPQSLADGITMVGNLLPDEEVDLSFETSGKIVEINFKEGSIVRKGELLAKVNDKPLLAQLSRYEAQLKLAEDRVYRQSALLEKDAVSQEAYEQASTELAMLNADIDIVKANIALTELRAPFDGIIGLRNVPGGGLRAGIEGGYRHAHAGRAGALSQYAGNAAAGTFRDRENPPARHS